MDAKSLRKFATIAVNKNVDISDIKSNEDYGDYLEYCDVFVDMGVTESKDVLDEDEFMLCKEVIKEYAKQRKHRSSKTGPKHDSN